MLKLAAVSAIAAAALGVTGYMQHQELSIFSDHPQQISCEQLATNGPGDNHHIILTDFAIPENHVVELNKWGTPRRAWIMAVPFGGEAHQTIQEAEHHDETPQGITSNVVIEINNVWTHDQFDLIIERDTLPGFIVNEYRPIDPETRQLLETGYAGYDIDSIWVMSFGEKPPSATVARAKLGAGGLFALLTVVLGLLGIVRRFNSEPAPEYAGVEGSPIITPRSAPIDHIPAMTREPDAPLVPQKADEESEQDEQRISA
ncbi:MAG: hypothetical protein ACF8GE_03365 [Phycisphaerales bacterium JB043]